MLQYLISLSHFFFFFLTLFSNWCGSSWIRLVSDGTQLSVTCHFPLLPHPHLRLCEEAEAFPCFPLPPVCVCLCVFTETQICNLRVHSHFVTIWFVVKCPLLTRGSDRRPSSPLIIFRWLSQDVPWMLTDYQIKSSRLWSWGENWNSSEKLM